MIRSAFIFFLFFCYIPVFSQSNVNAGDFLNQLKGKWLLATDTNAIMNCQSVKGEHLECNYSDSTRMYLSYSRIKESFHSIILYANGESKLLRGYIADDRLVLEEFNSRDNRTTGYRIIYVFIKGQIHCIEESKFNNSPWQKITDYYWVRVD